MRSYRIFLGLFFILVALLAIREVKSPDIGFHLKAGNYILAGHGWPRTDPFSFTMRDHRWVDVNWGYQVMLALVEKAGGAAGIGLFHLALILGTFVLVFGTIRLRAADPLLIAAALLAGVFAAEMRFHARPEVLSYFLLALELHLLHRYAEGRRLPLWALPLIQWFWANSHSLFVLGLGAQVAFVAGLALRDRRFDRRLAGMAGLSVAACLVNPYGLAGFTFPFTLLRFGGSSLFAAAIGELGSPWSLLFSGRTPPSLRLVLAVFWIMAGASIVAAAGLLRRQRLQALFVWLVFGALATRAIRNIPLFVIAALPAMVWGFADLGMGGAGARRGRGRRARRRVPVHAIGLAAAAALCAIFSLRVVTNAHYIAGRRPERFGIGWNHETLPVAAADHVRRVGLHDRMLNDFNFGGYLMWALPEPVFIDARIEVVGEEFYREYLAALSSPAALEAATGRYGIGWLIFPYVNNPALLRGMSVDPRWRLAYRDAASVIFVRNQPGCERYVDPRLAEPDSVARPAPDLATLPGIGRTPRPNAVARFVTACFQPQRFPLEDANLAIFHLYRGEIDDARREFARAIAASDGRYWEMYRNLGSILAREGRKEEAADCFRAVLADHHADEAVRSFLSTSPPSVR